MYTALLFDESSAHLSSRVGHGVAVSSFAESNLNTRKKNCIMVYMSAHDWEIAPAIRRNCKEVWMPVGKDDLEVEAGSPVSLPELGLWQRAVEETLGIGRDGRSL